MTLEKYNSKARQQLGSWFNDVVPLTMSDAFQRVFLISSFQGVDEAEKRPCC